MTRYNNRFPCGFLKVEITPKTNGDVLEWISRQIENPNKVQIIAGHNLHSVYLYHTIPDFRSFYDSAEIILADGYPVFRSWSYANGIRARSADYRVGSTDWIPLIGNVDALKRVAIVGATEESNLEFARIMSAVTDDVNFLSIPGENWKQQDHDAIVSKLAAYKADLTIVALGMPLQENFLSSYRHDLPEGVYATVGGAVDQIAGRQSLAPRWIGGIGFEWLWRLASHPQELWKRYLVEPIRLVYVLTCIMRSKK